VNRRGRPTIRSSDSSVTSRTSSTTSSVWRIEAPGVPGASVSQLRWCSVDRSIMCRRSLG
jgi:hypothetical protein